MPWRLETPSVSVKWTDSAAFLTLKVPTGSGAPSAKWSFVLIPQSWSWWVAELKYSERCRNSLACSDDIHLGFAFCWIPVKTHFSWLSEHALWGKGQRSVFWAKRVAFNAIAVLQENSWATKLIYYHYYFLFLYTASGSCFAHCSRLYLFCFSGHPAWVPQVLLHCAAVHDQFLPSSRSWINLHAV